MSVDGIEFQPGAVEVEVFDWPRYLAFLRPEGTPDGLLRGADPNAFHVLGIGIAGQDVATAIAFDHHGDRGISNMGTLEPFRRRGLATALLTRHLGFRDLGRFSEYVPAGAR